MKFLQNLEMSIEDRNKAIALVVGLIVVFFGDRAGASVDQLSSAVILIVGYILGDAYQKRGT